MRTASPSLQHLAAKIGAGDHAAFRRLYATCAPQVLAHVRRTLDDPTHSMHVVRATFCEVWWMCALDMRGRGTPPQDISAWIAAIANRRGGERRGALDLIHELKLAGQASFWIGLLADHDQCMRFELATMLDDHNDIEPLPVPHADPVPKL